MTTVPAPTAHVTSPAQERFWIVDQLETSGPAYTVATVLRFDGALRLDLLSAALDAAVARHAVLRTSFALLKDHPVQVVHPSAVIPVPAVDLSGLPVDLALAQADEVFAQDLLAPFDLSECPLARARLVRISADRHHFGLFVHHIVVDEWSMGVLLRDIAELYEAAQQGRPPVLLPLPLSYTDYAVRARRALDSRRREELIRFWRERMAGAPALLPLPTDRPRPPVQSFRGATTSIRIPSDVAGRLGVIARSAGATVFMALVAGLSAVLSRYGSGDDIVLGTSVADRGDSDFDDVVGCFFHTIPARTDLSGRPTFRELLGRVREWCLAGYAHRELPFEQLVEALGARRSAAHQPIYQVMMTMQTAERRPPALVGTSVTPIVPPHSGRTQFDLSVWAAHRTEGLDLVLNYATDLFDEATAAGLLRHLGVLLDAVSTGPDRPVAAIPLLVGAERDAVLTELSTGPRPAWDTRTVPVPELIRQQALRTPDAIAVGGCGARLTYRELDRHANRLAGVLRSAGVRPETAVGLALPRGPLFVATIQGIWRAGGAVVPLDPRLPIERQAHILRQSGATMLLVDRAGVAGSGPVLASLAEEQRPTVLEVGLDSLNDHSDEPSPVAVRPDNLAYIIFTSGTTGVPKGAMVTHDGLLNHALAKLDDLGFDDSDVLAQNGRSTFDLVIWQCCAPMLRGGQVWVVPDSVLADPVAHADELRAGGVTVLQAVPSTIELLLAGGSRVRSALARLRWLVPTGDALPAELTARWFAAYPDVPLLNTYGVTECSDDQCHAVVTRSDRGDSPITTIGRPIRYLTATVLDHDLEPVPNGAVGDVYLGGIGVGRGYAGRPGLTASRFVPDQFGVPGTRCYRTGDLVRRHRDGALEFIGRDDDQVKVRGFRIELGEVEAVLLRHPLVRAAVVVVSGAAGPDRKLIGYAAVGDDSTIKPVELRRFVAEHAPDYLVPHQVVVLDQLPLTAHGKLDRAALPDPVPVATVPPDKDAALAEDPLTGAVAAEMAAVLRRARVGGDEDFFDLGGTSLLAVGLILRVQAVCDVRLTLADLLPNPTVNGIAAAVRAAKGDSAAHNETVVPPAEDAPVPASFAQERLWVIDQIVDTPALYVAALAVEFRVRADRNAVHAAVSALFRRHDSLRTALVAQEGRPVQVIAPEVETPLVVTDLTNRAEEDADREQRRLLDEDAQSGFALDVVPLVRVRAIRRGEDRWVFGIMAHHVVTDGWSNGVIISDLAELLRAAACGRAAELPSLPIRYADYAIAQRAELNGDRAERLLEHWTRRLAGLPELTTPPSDHPRPLVASYRGGRVELDVPATTVDRVRRLARAEGATPFMVVLTALDVLLWRWTGQTDLAVGTAVTGRVRPDLRDIVGLFVNTLVLRVDLAGVRTFRDALHQTRDVCVAALAHADLPFELLVDRLRPPRSAAHHPLFQVNLVMQGGPAGDLPGAGAAPGIAPVTPPATRTAKFDLEIHVVPEASGWRLFVEFASDLFDAGTVRRMTDQLLRVLGAALADPDQQLSRLDSLPAAARNQLLEWGSGARPVNDGGMVPDLVAAQARENPHSPAIRSGTEVITYGEFLTEVRRLAERIRALGAVPDTVVGLLLPRGIGLVVAVHAVLAAGAAYLPLDPDQPIVRTAAMVADAGAAFVLGMQAGQAEVGVPVWSADALGEPSAGTQPDVVPVPGDALAYVLFTSGSTGRPKGVQVSRASLANRVRWMQELFAVGPGDQVMHKTPSSFDVSVWELCWPLTVGATMVLAGPGEHRYPDELAATMIRADVGTVHFVPTMLGPFLDAVERLPERPPLKQVFCSGEALAPHLVRRFHQVLPGVRLHDLYGPTEATVDVTWQPCDAPPGAIVPIGRPVPGVLVTVVDRDGDLVPVGVSGELYLGGVQVARGYAGRPDYTAERFVPDAHGPAGSRAYRTGDRARWRVDGTLEYQGRLDDQLKVRGMRVEPAEVESALAAYSNVEAAAVAMRDGRLVAYVVGTGIDTTELRQHVATLLPVHMVPAVFIPVPALPTGATGKLDRSRLPAAVSPPGKTYIPPRKGVQETLAAIWAEVLGVDRIGADDNFFELGGDSILSLMVVSRAAKAGVRIIPHQFFEQQTVAGLAAVAEAIETGPTPEQQPRQTVGVGVDAAAVAEVMVLLRAQDELTGEPDARRG